MANFYIISQQLIKTFEKEFEHYFALCKPLMKIYTNEQTPALQEALLGFDAKPCNTLLYSPSLSLLTLPFAAAKSIAERSSQPAILAIYQSREIALLENLKHSTVVDFLSLPSLDTVLQGNLPLLLRELFNLPYFCYTKEEFRLHLANVVYLLRSEPNYHVAMHQQNVTPYLLYIKEDFGVMLSKVTNPNAVFLIEDSGMTIAFWNFLYRQAKKNDQDQPPADYSSVGTISGSSAINERTFFRIDKCTVQREVANHLHSKRCILRTRLLFISLFCRYTPDRSLHSHHRSHRSHRCPLVVLLSVPQTR